jgi:hypothetical protein
MEPIYLQRLSFIKYLFSIGLYQSNQPELLYGVSILSFHDSIELFLHLSLEKLDISTKADPNFMEYWDIIDTKLKTASLSQKESMKRLNKARVDLKHLGIIPSKFDIESFRATTSAFFNENCPIIFGVNFDDISLIDIIKLERPKDLLKQAKEDFEKGWIDKSLENLALSFEYLILDYEESKKDDFNRSPFLFGESMTYLKSFYLGGIIKEDRKIRDFADKVAKSIEEIQKAIKILSFGIDYKKYVKFQSVVPSVVFSISNEPIFYTREGMTLSKEDLEFCINFIIESALKLQEFDFELKI